MPRAESQHSTANSNTNSNMLVLGVSGSLQHWHPMRLGDPDQNSLAWHSPSCCGHEE